MQKIKSQSNYNSKSPIALNNYNGSNYNVITIEDMLDFRNQAWTKAMRQNAPEHQLYLNNPDGTVSYNLEYVNPKSYRYNPTTKKYEGTGWNGQIGSQPDVGMKYFDSVTGNHGGVGIVSKPNGGFAADTRYIVDKWDLHPFAESNRTLSPFITKHFPKFSKNFEAVDFVGGNPFVLKQKIPQSYNLFKTLNLK